MRAVVLTFPGSNCDRDIATILSNFYHFQTELVWYRDTLPTCDLLVLPGGFSYGDYLRSGAIAGHTQALREVRRLAATGRPVLGICNGFQILCEAELLPGALLRNHSLKHIARTVGVKTGNWPLWKEERRLRIPVSHSDGNYYAAADTIRELEDNRRIVLKYTEEVNGSVQQIAGISSGNHRIIGMMPHPERAVDPLTGAQDGQVILQAVVALCA